MLKFIFGKRTSPAASPIRPSDADPIKRIVLKMPEVRQYTTALGRWRGYPEDACVMMGRRVVFLERRGLPGLEAFAAEMIGFRHEPFETRGSIQRPDGTEGKACPIITGVQLNETLDFLTAADRSESQGIIAPSNPLLLVPKVAEYIRPLGRMTILDWYLDKHVIAQTVLDGYRLAHFGPVDAMFAADRLGFSRFPEEDEPPPPMKTGHIEEIEVDVAFLSGIRRHIGGV